MAGQDIASNHYDLLKVKPSASPQEIRRAYRDLSKLYHPDTTQLPPEVATEKFQVLNEAYATLSNPERRVAYDYSVGISRVAVMQAPAYLNRPASQRRAYEKSNAYLDPTDRALSAGELFALFILGVTFVGCLLLVVTISWTKGELVLQPSPANALPTTEILEDPAAQTAAPETPNSPEIENAEVPSQAPLNNSSPAAEDAEGVSLPSIELSSKMI